MFKSTWIFLCWEVLEKWMKDLHIKHRRLKVRDDCTVLVDGSNSSQCLVLFLLVDNLTTHSMPDTALYSVRPIPQCLPVSTFLSLKLCPFIPWCLLPVVLALQPWTLAFGWDLNVLSLTWASLNHTSIFCYLVLVSSHSQDALRRDFCGQYFSLRGHPALLIPEFSRWLSPACMLPLWAYEPCLCHLVYLILNCI